MISNSGYQIFYIEVLKVVFGDNEGGLEMALIERHHSFVSGLCRRLLFNTFPFLPSTGE